ncbi:Lipase [Macleaya cordata]|uniref:Lipase n=1 Tax=Macleaya cordata TaxID=56857 RepID=A0A200R009_MACCD|nr:Lipase [Macleaya cordata]
MVILINLTHAATVPAIFIFGDSTADVGTNNYLEISMLARADYPHNGIDYPTMKPTGRFSNGFNGADYLAKLIGFRRSPPPFHALLNKTTPLRRHIFTGVNFASGGSGIIFGTGSFLGKVVSLGEQIEQFETVRGNLTELLGSAAATDAFLSESLFFISVGSNDIFDYFLDNTKPNMSEFMTKLSRTYEEHLKRLFKLGARKFGIVSTPPIGCCPSKRASNETGGCLEILNDYSRAFYSTTECLLIKLSSELKGMKYALGNAFEMVTNIMDNPLPYGFKNITSACCGGGKFNGGNPCLKTADVCWNRHEYLFWDWYHPTAAAANLSALTLYGGAPRFVTPINFRQLAEA